MEPEEFAYELDHRHGAGLDFNMIIYQGGPAIIKRTEQAQGKK